MKTELFTTLVFGKEERQNKKGEWYGLVGLSYGANALTVVCKNNDLFNNVKVNTPGKAVLSFNPSSKYLMLTLEEMEQ